MLFVNWPRAITTVLLCVCVHIPAFAQSLNAQQATLTRYEKQLDTLKNQQQNLAADLSTTETQLIPLDIKDSPEKASLDAAKVLLDQATLNYASNPTPKNKAIKSNAAFKHALAERKFKKANEQLFELQQQREQLEQELATTERQINSLNDKIKVQRQTIERLQAQQVANAKIQKQQQLEKQRKAENEIQRLRAELDRQKQLEAQRDNEAEQSATPISAATPPKIAPSTPAAESTQEAATNSKAITDTPATTPAALTAQPAKTPAITLGKGAYLLTNKQQVQAEEQRLVELQTTRGRKLSRSNKILNIKTVRANGSISRPNAKTLRSLGNDQYKGSIKLKKGSYILIVGFNKWRQSIPAEADGTEYIFIYDASEKKEPRLVYFDKALSSI